MRTASLSSSFTQTAGSKPSDQSVVIGAGGAHSVTRHSMSEPLEGTTYRGHFLVADIAMSAPFPRDEAGVICGPNGLLLLAPLPGGRWISFQDLEEDVETVSAEEVVARVVVRLGEKYRPTDVAWFAPFRMHRRIVSRLADGHAFLIGDAAHLSSPFGGEGLNAGLHDGYDLAWKLALVLRGHASQALLDGYMAERRIADHHVLDVSDHVHCSIVDVADAARQRREIHAAVVDPIAAALVRNSRAMIDVDYWGSPLVVDHGEAGRARRAASRAVVSRLGRVWWNVTPRARLWRRRRRRVARAVGPTLVEARRDLSQSPASIPSAPASRRAA